MRDLGIIEISSSPEPSSPPRPQKRRSRTRPPHSPKDIIEVNESDDDTPVAGPSNLKANAEQDKVLANHEASGSHPKAGRVEHDQAQPKPPPLLAESQAGLPLFLPDPDEASPPPMSRNTTPSVGPAGSAGAQQLPPNPPSEPEPQNIEERDPIDLYIAQVLDIIPDVVPEHVRRLVTHHLTTHPDNVVEQVLHVLFESPTYPKVDRKGKGKRRREEADDAEPERASVKSKVDYASKDRKREGGPNYFALAMEQLQSDFPLIAVYHIGNVFAANGALYAPAYLALLEQQENGKLTPKQKLKVARTRRKGKRIQATDDELEKEKAWLKARLEPESPPVDSSAAEIDDEEGDIECGCCFSTSAFGKMIQCPETHLFCMSCMTTYASNLLGAHDPNIICMDQSGCKLPFPESELHRFLSPKLLALYERVKQRKEIEAAGLENLEECPFCEYKVVIENPMERLFRCENEDCGTVTCRECKKLDHLPKSCKEVEEDKKLDGRHVIEEAMTRALMRNCPKCNKAFVKTEGCNKMTCPDCRTLSCYACRQIITGYDHFGGQTGPNHPAANQDPTKPQKCQLWDSVEQRHNHDVREAAEKALEEYKAAHPDIKEDDLKIDLPPPVAGPSNIRPAGAPVQPGAPDMDLLAVVQRERQLLAQDIARLDQLNHARHMRAAAAIADMNAGVAQPPAGNVHPRAPMLVGVPGLFGAAQPMAPLFPAPVVGPPPLPAPFPQVPARAPPARPPVPRPPPPRRPAPARPPVRRATRSNTRAAAAAPPKLR